MTLTQIKPAGLSKPVDLADNEKIRLGTGNDFEIHHNGNNSLISNSTGDLIIDSGGTSSTVLRSRFDSTVFNNAANNLNQLVLDGGMVRLYESGNEKFRTLSTGAKITGDVESTTGIFERTNNGTSQLKFNNTNETQLKHLSNGQVKFSLIGYNSAFGGAIDAQTSSNYIRILNAADEQAVTCRTNGAVELYYDDSKKLETYSGGVNIYGRVAPNEFQISDNEKAYFGTGLDLEIYHDGTNSYIADVGTGELRLRGTTIRLTDHNGTENFANFLDNGAVELFYDNSKKLETTSSGATVTGSLGIGTTSPSSKIDIHCGTDNTGLQITSTDAGAFASYFDNTGASSIGHSGTNLVLSCDPAGSVSSSNIVFQVDSNNERMRIDSAGRLLVNTTSANTSIPYTSGAAIQTEGTYNTASVSITNNEANGNTSALMLLKKRGTSGGVNTGDVAGSVGWGAYDGSAWRTIGLMSAKLTGSGSNNVPTDLVFNANSGSSNGERFRIRGGGGVTFNGDTAAANALDDYEEGTFTPTMTYSTLQQAPQGTFAGQYQKVGNCVHFQARFTLTDEGSGIDNIKLTNLPFTPNTSSFTHPMATFFAINGVNTGDADKMIVAQLQTSAYVFYVVGIHDSDNYGAFHMNMTDDSAIFGCYGHYYTSS